jgi:hypothetical protein
MSEHECCPWETYPHIWKTKSVFFSWLRGGLRRGLWEKYPPKLEFKNKVCKPPPEGYEGKAKSGIECALTGEWEGKSKLEIDHKSGNVSLKDWDDLIPFIMHLCFDSDDKVQAVQRDAHKIKSYAEKWGMTFNQALVEKKTIAICKDSKATIDCIKAKGITPEKNAKLRRTQVKSILEQEMKNGN